MKLALGTVQFGLNYGISNKSGQTSNEEIRAILDYAANAGIDLLDTAPSYGTSEQVIGELSPNKGSFKIVTKTPVQDSSYDINQQVEYFKRIFSKSLENLKRLSVYGLLVHHVEDLMQHNSDRLWAVLEDLKTRGCVSKIGVSVYNGDQIDKILDRFPIDLIQLPLNVFDQRLIKTGHLTKLKSLGIEIHARSVFLQGLLLMSPSDIPPNLKFACDKIQRYQQSIAAIGLSPLQSALSFVANIPEIDKIVVGVNSLKQLNEMCNIDTGPNGIDYDEFASDNESIINPSKW